MTLAEKYGIQKHVEVGSINLDQNPYSYEGTFNEIYSLMVTNKLKLLKQGDMIVGGSVSGYDNTEDDNLASAAFMKAFMLKPLLQYVNLATELVEANLIPTVISENPLRVSILNGRVTLDMYGNEVEEDKVEPEAEVQDEDDEIRIDALELDDPEDEVDAWKQIKHYLRKEYGRCLARDYEPHFYYDDDTDEYVVCNLKWGRKLTAKELEKLA